jgi:hypothetical protein
MQPNYLHSVNTYRCALIIYTFAIGVMYPVNFLLKWKHLKIKII